MNTGDIIIKAVGDISLGDYNMTLGFGVRSKIENYGSKYIFSNISNILQNANIVFGNLETPLSSEKIDSKEYKSLIMRAPPTSIDGLKSCGFNILNIANNHIMQHGENAFLETCNLLYENNIHPLGVCSNKEFSSIPVFFNKENRNIAFLGYSLVNELYSKRIMYAKGEPEKIKADLKKVKGQSDLVVLSLHWGLELMEKPSQAIRILAHSFVDAGADIILGHHPHVVQGIETYCGKPIFYSLGNFVFDINHEPCRRSIIGEVKITDNGIIKKFIPIHINRNYQPYLVQGQKREIISSKVYMLSENLNSNNTLIVDEDKNLAYYKERSKLQRIEKISICLQLLKNILNVKTSVLLKIMSEKILNLLFNKYLVK